jgi:hypothetical protein
VSRSSRASSKYGHVLAERALVELAEAARDLGREPRVLRGREFAVIAGHALFPLRYANRAQPLEKARLKSSASLQRRRLLTAHAPQQPALFEIDDDLTTDEYEELHRTCEELGATIGSGGAKPRWSRTGPSAGRTRSNCPYRLSGAVPCQGREGELRALLALGIAYVDGAGGGGDLDAIGARETRAASRVTATRSGATPP